MKSILARIILVLNYHHLLKWVNDRKCVELLYEAYTGKKLDLENPNRFNEKLQWIKLYDRRPEYTQYVDKYAVRSYVRAKIGEQYLIPLIGVWKNAREIDFNEMPNQFVLKCNHDSGSVIFCKNKNEFDIVKARKKLNHALKKGTFYHGREWPYKNVERKIIAEKFMSDGTGKELNDYKVFCFNGVARLVQIHKGRYSNHTQDYYDIEWNKLDIYQGVPQSSELMPKPEFLDEMLRLSEILSQGIPEVRIDWYAINGVLYFGEMTFFDGSGFDEFEPDQWNEILGSWIILPQKYS